MQSPHCLQTTRQFAYQDTPVSYAVEQCDAAGDEAAQLLCVHGITRNRHDFHVLLPQLAGVSASARRISSATATAPGWASG